jgi:Uma2 family endonuclease
MSITTTTPPTSAPRHQGPSTFLGGLAGDQRIVIRGVNADLYNRIDEAIGDGQHVHVAYDGKDLELMTTSDIHEWYNRVFEKLMTALLLAQGIRYVHCGQKTWKTEDADRGLEADLSYYFDPEKIRVATAALARGSRDRKDYPISPDLAVEIDISRAQVDRPAIYRALRAAEVWRFNGQRLLFEQLQPDGTYAPSEESRWQRVRPDEVLAWLKAEDVTDQDAWSLRLFQWALDQRRGA